MLTYMHFAADVSANQYRDRSTTEHVLKLHDNESQKVTYIVVLLQQPRFKVSVVERMSHTTKYTSQHENRKDIEVLEEQKELLEKVREEATRILTSERQWMV